MTAAASCIKKQFSNIQCKFLREVRQTAVKFCFKLPQNKIFSSRFCTFKRKFSDKKLTTPTKVKRGEANAFHATTHDDHVQNTKKTPAEMFCQRFSFYVAYNNVQTI